MKDVKRIAMLIPGSIAIGLGLLLASSSVQIAILTPATGWWLALLGVFMASGKTRGMRMLGFGAIALGFYIGLRSADIIRFPYVRVGVAAMLVALGAISIYNQLSKSKQS